MNKGQIVKGFGRLVRPRSAVASFSLRLLLLRLVCLCSYLSRQSKGTEQIPGINMSGRKLPPKSKQLLASL